MMGSRERPGASEDVDEAAERFISSLTGELEGTETNPQPFQPRTIFRVPNHIRKVDPEAYEPQVISFGPYHHGKTELRAMDEIKRSYLKRILYRNQHVGLKQYYMAIEALEAQARSCYSEDINMGSKDFIKMMLLDGCFIIEVLLMYRPDEGIIRVDRDDPIRATKWAFYLVLWDMILLENQLPFLVLQALLKIRRSSPNELVNLTLQFFQCVLQNTGLSVRVSSPSQLEPSHILEIIHSCFNPPQPRPRPQPPPPPPPAPEPEPEPELGAALQMLQPSLPPPPRPVLGASQQMPPPELIPSAKELEEAGVKFRKKEADKTMDVTFRGGGIIRSGTIEIPYLPIDDHTNTLLRNLIAFEQCDSTDKLYVTTYAIFMGCIFKTPEDVAMLHRRGIIMNNLGSYKDVTKLFNDLCKGAIINLENSYLRRLFDDVRKHCNSRVNKWRATLKHDYFSNPWASISLFGAVTILVLTTLQTVYTIK